MYTSLMHMYVVTDLRTQQGFHKPMKDKFFVLILRFGKNPTSCRSHSKPLFSRYIKPYMHLFKTILKENLRFTRNSESKREFFTKYFQVNFIVIETFSWSLSLSFEVY